MRIFLLLTSFCVVNNIFTQSLYIKSESSTSGMAGVPSVIANTMKVTTESFIKNNRVKIVSQAPGLTQTQYFENEKVTIINSTESNCVIITKAELAEDSLENDAFVSELKINETSESKTLLGYKCLKTVINYKISNDKSQIIFTENEMTLWITHDLQFAEQKNTVLETTKKNALSSAIQSLGGTALETTTVMKANGITTKSAVLEINSKEIKESVFEVNPKSCKSPLNLKDYKKLLLKRKRQADNYHFGY